MLGEKNCDVIIDGGFEMYVRSLVSFLNKNIQISFDSSSNRVSLGVKDPKVDRAT